MGGKVLEYETKTIFHEGMRERKNEGLREGRFKMKIYRSADFTIRPLCGWMDNTDAAALLFMDYDILYAMTTISRW